MLCSTLNTAPPAQVKVEDAGFDWKILGPDVQEEEYVAHTCDQDAYAYRYTRQAELSLFAVFFFLFFGNPPCLR